MARADQIKALFRALADGQSDRVYAIGLQLAADQAQRGHVKLADELRGVVEAARTKSEGSTARPIPLAQPKGDLAELLTVHYPRHPLAHMVASPEVAQKLQRVLTEQRQHERLREHGLSPRRKLLLVGPPGTGKTLTASVLATELRLPLFVARFDSLITKFMGESATKLRSVFDALRATRGVYLFDEFDSLGLERGSQHDVAEIRRTLNTFLQLIEQDQSESLIVAASNHGSSLDAALFRRFDDVVRYANPKDREIEALLQNSLALMAPAQMHYDAMVKAARGLSHSDIVSASMDSLKDAVLCHQSAVSEASVLGHLAERSDSVGKKSP